MSMNSSAENDMEMLRNNKMEGYEWRERRHDDWRENYSLYRDKVFVNRLTQRQSVNLPLMKGTIKTALKDVDDMTMLFYENLDNDEEAEIVLNEYWRITEEINKMELRDIVDKKQAMLMGRTFKMLNIVDGQCDIRVVDPQDILVSRFIDPTQLESSRYLIHTHIFKPLSQLKMSKIYDKQALDHLERFHATEMGVMKASDNQQMLNEKNRRMRDMGVADVDSPVLGETFVELCLHFCYPLGEDQLYMYVEADDEVILMKKPLEEVIGVTSNNFWQKHYPYTTWGEDIDNTDFWSDGLADVVRTPNKVLNSFYSQLIENRTLRNFGMHFYNSNLENGEFFPDTFEAKPWGWYPIPVPSGGRLQDVMQSVQIPDLSESLDEMGFIMQVLERVTGANATRQGMAEGGAITLGAIQFALTEAKEMTQSMGKFYVFEKKELGSKFVKLVEAGADRLTDITAYKKGKDGNKMYGKVIVPKKTVTKSGAHVKVWSQNDKNTQDAKKLEKLHIVRTSMPDNPKVVEVFNRKLLEFSDFTAEEMNAALEYEQKKQLMMQNGTMPPLANGAPVAPMATTAQQ